MVKQNIKYIVNYWNIQDLSEVSKNFKELDCDKLEFKGLKYPEPHKRLEEFSNNYDGDYIIIYTNDLVVTKKNLHIIVETLKNNNYPVLSGVCTPVRKHLPNTLNVCIEPLKGTDYNWVMKGEYKGIHQVGFAGLPLMAIHKSVFKKFNFYREGTNNTALDRRFCAWCVEKQIPIMVDFDNEMVHLDIHPNTSNNSTV